MVLWGKCKSQEWSYCRKQEQHLLGILHWDQSSSLLKVKAIELTMDSDFRV